MMIQNPKTSTQGGGTMLGIIIGVLVGLGAALVVAVYITKVPVPFVTKGVTNMSAEQEAAEVKKNKDWDPNAPLYGKSGGKPGAAGSAQTPATPKPAVTGVDANTKAADGSKTLTKTDGTNYIPPAAVPKPPVVSTADPLGDLAKAKSKPVVTSTTASADPFIYFVQAGAYRTPEDAETQRARLGMLGIETKVSDREQAGRTIYRVRVGPFDKKEDADSAKDKLDGNGIDTALVRAQR